MAAHVTLDGVLACCLEVAEAVGTVASHRLPRFSFDGGCPLYTSGTCLVGRVNLLSRRLSAETN